MKMPKLKSYKVLSIIIFVILGIFILFMTTEKTRALRALEKNLYKRYGEEFNISALYKRKSNSGIRYQAEYIYPKSYDGTLKSYDSYYWGKGFVKVENFGLRLKAGDTYGGVLLNESANEFYLPKLKELFGENVLPILNIKGAYEYTDFQKEYLRAKKTISGGIYIFGRVESDEDREWYRKQIYEFVQFMKETGTFEYVSLWLVVADERVLSDEFVNNKKDKEKLLRLHNENETEFRKQRAEIMKKYSKSYDETAIENIRERTDNILKSDLYDTGGNAIGLARMTYYNELLVTPLYSEKYIKSQSLEDNYKLKDYDKVEDVEFTEEFY